MSIPAENRLECPQDMKLVGPSLEYKKSFEEAIEELRKTGDRMGLWEDIGSPKNIEEYIRLRKDHSQGKDLPTGYIPSTTYWLLDNGKVVGEVHVRHQLTEHLRNEGGHIGYWIRPTKRQQGYGKKILELALEKARDLGIEKALVTCDTTNTASKRIIESNGGVLEQAKDPQGKPKKLLYWIDLK
ncbi:GNAT family N-acetyltransferase [Candidatus Peregrinibacteria bacterium]|nr:GNAT family N-acetyltransferase [Candidatus Peregrinibacteria bacterium]